MNRTTLIKESKMANQRTTLTFFRYFLLPFALAVGLPHKIHYVGFKQCITITILCLIKGHTRFIHIVKKRCLFIEWIFVIFFFDILLCTEFFGDTIFFVRIFDLSGRFNLCGVWETHIYQKPNLLNSKFKIERRCWDPNSTRAALGIFSVPSFTFTIDARVHQYQQQQLFRAEI